MNPVFHFATDIIKIANKTGKNLYTICMEREISLTQKTEEQIRNILQSRLIVMKKSVEKALSSPRRTMGDLGGTDASHLKNTLEKNGYEEMTMSQTALKAGMYAIANNENNACMGCIVACPTAGSSGVVPGVFLATQEKYKFSEKTLIDGLVVASGIGAIISENATVSGAEGGCQAEIGSAIAMAAAGLTYMRGGDTEQCIDSATLGLKNTLGLACDPIGGMVEVPCIKRNGFASQFALFGSDIAMMGIKSQVPFDEVVQALDSIGKMMPRQIRETALGGLAMTPTGQAVNKRLGIEISD